MGVWAEDVQAGHQGNFKKSSHVKTSGKIQSGIWQIVAKMQKNNFWCVLILVLGSAPLQWSKEYTSMATFLEKSLSVWLYFFRDRTETGRSKKVVKTILKIRNVVDRC